MSAGIFCASFSVGEITLSFIVLEPRLDRRRVSQPHCARPGKRTQVARIASLRLAPPPTLDCRSLPGFLRAPARTSLASRSLLTRFLAEAAGTLGLQEEHAEHRKNNNHRIDRMAETAIVLVGDVINQRKEDQWNKKRDRFLQPVANRPSQSDE